ncbi:NmrA-like protein [Grosmannia clavigera kw1407]|uniref:NmrA-like protein n=1 Tax=Grosmannia clavigera (strain kw1407 / UAMH 11150) TaxID=655863 RepID=F0XJC2_GROCL|nr:NmrA-like protein [Grosmannia clavigera kw1407]EFX02253.1 NmrA-like protein [Grosmannia clavigera kw1407]
MSKIFAVFGATGQQGGSVIDHVLGNPLLAAIYKVRAITRDITTVKAAQLRDQNVEVVHGDADDRGSLNAALAGVHSVFAMTMPAHRPSTVEQAVEAELCAARNIADAAQTQGVAFFIFSSLLSPTALSHGRYTRFLPAEAKARAEQYIRGLAFPEGIAIFMPAYFMQNFVAAPFMPLLPEPGASASTTARWTLTSHLPPSARLALIDVATDSGRFVGTILANPNRYRGKTVCAAAGQFTIPQVAAAMAAATGKDIGYRQIPLDEYRAAIPPFVAEFLPDGLSAWTEFGYYGTDSDRLITEALEDLHGSLVTTPADFFAAHPPKLE